jgi:hypothetical protein
MGEMATDGSAGGFLSTVKDAVFEAADMFPNESVWRAVAVYVPLPKNPPLMPVQVLQVQLPFAGSAATVHVPTVVFPAFFTVTASASPASPLPPEAAGGFGPARPMRAGKVSVGAGGGCWRTEKLVEFAAAVCGFPRASVCETATL